MTVVPAPEDAARSDQLAAALAAVEQRVAAAARAAGRRREELVLVAVSKTRPVEDVIALARLGQCDFGESRWQELSPKVTKLGPTAGELRWHFVGRLQRNKTRAVGRLADAVHSLDRVELCAPLARGAADVGRRVGVFVQVSLDGDPQRGGAAPEDVARVADAVAACGELHLLGLMAVPPRGAPPRPAFARLRELGARLQQDHPGASMLSAGMSADLEPAVAEGATHLRIGTALFGLRA